MKRRIVGLDVNGRFDHAARDWREDEDAVEALESEIVHGGTCAAVVMTRDNRLIAGPQAALAPHGRGKGWGKIGDPSRRRPLAEALDRGARDQADAEAVEAAVYALARESTEVVVVVPDLADFGEAEQGAMIAAMSVRHRRVRLLWRPVAVFLDLLRTGRIPPEPEGARFRLANQAGVSLCGVGDVSDLVGRSPFELFHAEDHVTIGERIQAMQAARTRVPPVELRVVRPDGGTVAVESTAISYADDTGPAILVMLRDITARKQTERQLQHAQRLEAVGQLTGGMAHDFNNLLAVVVGNLDLLEAKLEGDPDARELSDTALQAALRGAELTRQLLAFSRRQVLEPKVFDLNRMVRETTHLLRRTLGERIVIRLQLAEALWPATADPGQVESALVNLAINARDAMPAGGQLTIETGNKHLDEQYAAENIEVMPGDYVMVAVSDTGTGIPPEVLDRVFEPFFTTKADGKGSGLGLAMIYGFAKQSRGHVKIYSEPGHGTTVRLYLPRAGAAGGAHHCACGG